MYKKKVSACAEAKVLIRQTQALRSKSTVSFKVVLAEKSGILVKQILLELHNFT